MLALNDRALLDLPNRRLKLFEVEPTDLGELVRCQSGWGLASKVLAYARPGRDSQWIELGWRREGVIRGFFRDRAQAHLWAAYTEPSRARELGRPGNEQNLRVALARPLLGSASLPEGYRSELANSSMAGEISALLQSTFPVYPTPLYPGHISQAISSRANLFRVVRDSEGKLAAVASAELDLQRQSAEMTDCATAPAHRGRGLMARLLFRLELDVRRLFGICDFYTLARACEVSMNCVFGKLGYSSTGRLVSNCRMPNGWESMNIWCKQVGA